MQKLLFSAGLLFFFSFNAGAQGTDHVWLETSQLKVRINADGRLFCDDEKGAFLVPYGDSMVTLMRGAGFWLGGMDPGNNLIISAQTPDPVLTDFAAGAIDVPNSGKVWKVTQAEILAHRQDYLDNWLIDNPIPSVFGWPAAGNINFYQINGFDWSSAPFPFFDDSDGVYEPEKGEFPFLGILNFDSDWQIPTQMACFCFNTDAPQLLSKSLRPAPVQVWGLAFVYDCPENELLSRSVFVHYFWDNVGDFRLDSTMVSSLVDIDLGDPSDDYHGFLANYSTYFAYNADSLDAVWGINTPMMFVRSVSNPVALKFFPATGDYESLMLPMRTMPYGIGIPNFIAISPAENAYECYNYMTNTWRDGTRLTTGGLGYNPGNSNATPTNQPFPGYPDQPNEWSERSAQNSFGNRRALLNFENGILLPQSRHNMTLQFSYVPKGSGTLTDQIQAIESQNEYLYNQLSCCIDFNPPLPEIGCAFNIPFAQEPDALSIFPSPANQLLKVWHPNIYLRKMLLFDLLGRIVGIGEYRDDYSEISVANLPNGPYALQIETENGTRKAQIIVVDHGQE